MTKELLNKKNWIIDRPVKNQYGKLVYVTGRTDGGSVIWSDGSVEDSISFHKNLVDYNDLRQEIAEKQSNRIS